MSLLIDFDSRQTAETACFEPEYLALIPLRDRVFARFEMFLALRGTI